MSTTPKRPRDPYASTYHRDGTVSIWSVWRQVWIRTDDPSEAALACLAGYKGRKECERVERHIARHKARR